MSKKDQLLPAISDEKEEWVNALPDDELRWELLNSTGLLETQTLQHKKLVATYTELLTAYNRLLKEHEEVNDHITELSEALVFLRENTIEEMLTSENFNIRAVGKHVEELSKRR